MIGANEKQESEFIRGLVVLQEETKEKEEALKLAEEDAVQLAREGAVDVSDEEVEHGLQSDDEEDEEEEEKEFLEDCPPGLNQRAVDPEWVDLMVHQIEETGKSKFMTPMAVVLDETDVRYIYSILLSISFRKKFL